MAPESGQERDQRRRSRTLFDGAAGRYQQNRPGYPDSLVARIAGTAGLSHGAPVLEIGCGTGQLTEPLARAGFAVTAIDIGPSMVEAARSRLSGLPVTFQVTGFEDFAAPDGSFGLIVSAAAFHWIDPEVKYARAARLLRPGGWLAVIDGDETYDEPFGSALHELWEARCADDDGAWTRQQASAREFDGTGLFGAPVQFTGTETLIRSADGIVGVESTRAISLAWPGDVRDGFTADIRKALEGTPAVPVTREIIVIMSQVR